MANKYDFGALEVGIPKLIEFPETDPQKLIFYVRSAWQIYKKYNAVDWNVKIKEVDNGVLIEKI